MIAYLNKSLLKALLTATNKNELRTPLSNVYFDVKKNRLYATDANIGVAINAKAMVLSPPSAGIKSVYFPRSVLDWMYKHRAYKLEVNDASTLFTVSADSELHSVKTETPPAFPDLQSLFKKPKLPVLHPGVFNVAYMRAAVDIRDALSTSAGRIPAVPFQADLSPYALSSDFMSAHTHLLNIVGYHKDEKDDFEIILMPLRL